ncbi:baseplate J/gp47 family protein [Shewanella sp. MTB7]|uniref:baseplate J/gp47 family protein n=1 Tax=Shewanella sp. MTB7 TaxID=2746932 RepID=UPI0022BA2882|nr:baseplate J/gp47 family protein [Shewanella sp. MTB7]WBJ93569.1 baseplate J/gp47 family protein [Shewanella sp. MTB7]
MNVPKVDFKQVLAESGVPTTDADITERLAQAVTAAGSQIANDRAMSPWWRLVKAVVVTPTMWLTNTLVAEHVLPNLFVATAKKIYLDLKASDIGLERHQDESTLGRVLFTKLEPTAVIMVSANTLIDTAPINGVVLSLITLHDTQITAEQPSSLIDCMATVNGQNHNLSAGYFNRLRVPIEGIAFVSNEPDWITQPGADEETDDALSLRIRNRYGAAGHYHIDAVYRDIVANSSGVRVDHIYFEHDAPRGPGTANCYIFADVGDVPQASIDAANAHIAKGYHGHGDDMRVMAMPSQPIALTASYWPAPTATALHVAQLSDDITLRIHAAFRQHGELSSISRVWPMSTFSLSQLIAECHNDASLRRSTFCRRRHHKHHEHPRFTVSYS